MQPIFAEHPLVPQEQADLRAYLLSVSDQPLANTEVPFLVLSLAGFFAAMIAIGIVGRLVGAAGHPRGSRKGRDDA
jgi:hypothetical protein